MPTSEPPTPEPPTSDPPTPESGAPGQLDLLTVALPNKGSLAEDAAHLMVECGYRCRRGPNSLRVIDRNGGVEFLFLRPRDIATYVGEGIIAFGVTGRDLALDSGANVDELMELGFGQSEFRLASPLGPDGAPRPVDLFADPPVRIATSYATLLQRHVEKQGGRARIVPLDGAVELAPQLGVADAVADVVQSGRTLREAGLGVVGEPIVRSVGVLIGHAGAALTDAGHRLVERVRGAVVAAAYLMVEYDIPEDRVEDGARLTPGLEAPTISPLSKPGWVAVRALVPRVELNDKLDLLYALGARGIVATDVRTARL